MRFPFRRNDFGNVFRKTRSKNNQQRQTEHGGDQMGERRKPKRKGKGDRCPNSEHTSAYAAERQLAQALHRRKQTQCKKGSDKLPHKEPENPEHRATSFLRKDICIISDSAAIATVLQSLAFTEIA